MLTRKYFLAVLTIFIVSSSIYYFKSTTSKAVNSTITSQNDTTGSKIRHIILLVDYIAGDYKEAIGEPGVIKNSDEYSEMLEFSKLIAEMYPKEQKTSKTIQAQITELQQAIENKSNIEKVKKLALNLRHELVSYHELTVTLKQIPNLENGHDLFIKQCASCHGAEGDAKTPMAQVLNPPPRNLLEAEFLEDLSPSRVYNTLKVGIPDTAMASYDNILNEKEKWDLSFYVLSLPYLGHEKKAIVLKDETREKISWNLLATLSNKELKDFLSDKTGIKGQELKILTRNLRTAQFADKAFTLNKDFQINLGQQKKTQDESLQFALRKIREVKEKIRKNYLTEVHDDLLSGYLEGFESVERKLQILDATLMRRVERNFMSLRAKAKAKANDLDIEAFALDLDQLEKDVSAASELLLAKNKVTKASPLSDLVASAIIILREGLEAFLIIIALLSLVNNLGIASARIWIHSAWLSAVALGFVTFLLIEKVFSLSGANRELLEAFFTGLAVFMLFYTGFWLLSQSQRKWTSFITGKSKAELSQGNLWTFFSLAFVAVYREAAETVLFYQALLSTTSNTAMTVVGFVIGVALLLMLCFAIYHYNIKIPLRKFFKLTSSLMFSLSFILAGKAAYELIEANYITQTTVPFIPTVDFLGIYPFVETIVPQLLLLTITLTLIYKSETNSTQKTVGQS